MNIAVIGTGYVGLVAGVCFADSGHSVVCVDSNAEKIKILTSGKVPFYEPGLEDLFRLNAGRMRFTQSIADAVQSAPVVFIAVGTPELPDGSSDMTATLNVLKEICGAATASKILVLKSTVPVGTAKQVAEFCRLHSKHSMDIVNNPEFLRQGSALEDFLRPDRVVIGTSSASATQVMQALYQPFVSRGSSKPILVMDNTSAEMTKYVANSFLALKISFINEISLLADALGADVESVKAGFTSDARINPAFFNPGIGYGGSCFPKDVRSLIHTGKKAGVDLKILQATDDVNENQKTVLTNRLKDRLGDLKGKTVGVWGLAFKPRTDDVRRAPSLKIIEDLFLNGAQVQAFDPVASENAKATCRVPFKVCASSIEAATGVDALLIVTEWQEFKSADWSALKAKMKQPLVFDGRNLFDPEKMKSLGIEYHSIGRKVRSL